MDNISTAPTGSLPRPLTSLIGRERELADLADMLGRDDVQLVTLTGPGGVGKTRLAIEVATKVRRAFPEGAWFVDLAPVRDAARVIPEIAQAIGIHGRTETAQALLAALGSESDRLLLLDNFEHVIDAAPAIVALLAGKPELTILVTSREPLKVGGEREYPIAPLPVDSNGDTDTSGAIRLFAERAQGALPSFSITPENTSALAEICRRLDGLPLAIELAAARIKLLPPVLMLARLDQRLSLLSGTRRDLPARQQTMRGAIAWSYDHLSPAEKALFRRLGVFVGGFTFDAAESVAAIPGDVAIDLLRDLTSLVDKSLVRQDDASGGEPRYLMLETIREFANERLLASDEAAAIRNAHAEWCKSVAIERWLHGDIWTEPPVPGRTMPIVETEYGNIRAALAWLDESDNPNGIADIAGSMWWYWHVRGPRTEGVRWLRRAREARVDSAADKTARLWALDGLALMTRNLGELAEAAGAAQECLDLARELGDVLGQASGHALLGDVELARGDYERADRLGRQGIELREQSSKGWAVEVVYQLVGLAALGRGDLDTAETWLESALAGLGNYGVPFDVQLNTRYLSLVRIKRGQSQLAAIGLAEALPILLDLKNQENTAEWLADVATLAEATGELEPGARFLGAAATLRDAVGHAFVLPERAVYEQAEQSIRDRLGGEKFALAWRAGAALSIQQAIADASSLLDQVREPVTPASSTRGENPFGLTARELEVIRLLVHGKSDKEIAGALFIGTRTVESHVANLLAKLGAANRTEAAALAVREGLVGSS